MDTRLFQSQVKEKLCQCIFHIFVNRRLFSERMESPAIKMKFTIQSEMRSERGRGAKLFKTNVYLEK